MSVESELTSWIIDRYNEIINHLSVDSPLGALVTTSEYLEAFNKAGAMPEDTEEAKEAKREAHERVLPCEEESYAASIEADDIRTLLLLVMPKEKLAESELLGKINTDMENVVRSVYFMMGDAGPSWWYR